MLRRWLKPCPRCRGNHLIEMKEEAFHAVKCVQCGYLLSSDEIRFLLEDMIFETVAGAEKSAA